MLADELGGRQSRALDQRQGDAQHCLRKNYRRQLHRRFAMTTMNGHPILPARDQALINAVGSELNERDQRIAALEQRIAALEQRLENFGDRGVWKEGEIYFQNNYTSHNGSYWVCKAATMARPGTDGSWRLVVKHGRDGKDADMRRAPTAQSRGLNDV